MNDYMQVRLDVEPCSEMATDILAAALAEIGYESFVPDETGVTAFVPQGKYDEVQLQSVVEQFPVEGIALSYEATFVPGQDWNEEWEKNYFKPIVVGDECVIHSTFHHDVPQARYDVLIDPKMAFGTGHHETTTLMLQAILATDFTGRAVLDMGCGTAVLAILACMKGAGPVVAVDIDEFATENAAENIRLNGVPEIEVRLGGADALRQEQFDYIFANINRNILLADMAAYVEHMKGGAHLFMSGFYVDDIPVIRAEAERLGLHFLGHTEKNRWVAVDFVKA
ncbi:MAG TPA: 50S ribosomal protein L11 methyltransferase [Candidatus Barnesiella excrementigallinarum]|nr:50S ribosomal protein L11 methyltransferase [Candidatus Barnesiella excrementigallinarum]